MNSLKEVADSDLIKMLERFGDPSDNEHAIHEMQRACREAAAELRGRGQPAPDREATEALHIINELRAAEASSVEILCPNPDFNGQPNNVVVCNGEWTGWNDRRFGGDTLLNELRNAYKVFEAVEGTDTSSETANNRTPGVSQPVESRQPPSDVEAGEAALDEPVADHDLSAGQIVHQDANGVLGRTVVEPMQHGDLGRGENADHVGSVASGNLPNKPKAPLPATGGHDWKATARILSDALLTVRPLGGSEMFVKMGGEYIADPVFCRAEIARLRSDLHEAKMGKIGAEQAAADIATKLRCAEEQLTRIEALVPDWRAFRDLPEAVEVTLHALRSDPRLTAAPAASHSDPHPRWKPNDGSDRHPQTSDEWDYQKDRAGEAFGRSLRRLKVAGDYDDPRAPDQMALVLRIDILRLIGDWTHKNAAVAALRSPCDGPRWKHTIRGSIYTEIGRGGLQASSGPVAEGETLVAYRSDDDGELTFREVSEFEDGRFERVPDLPTQSDDSCKLVRAMRGGVAAGAK